MGTSAVETSARPIEDELGQMFGEPSESGSETPDAGSTADAGAPPADAGSPPSDPADAASGESAEAAPPTGEPAADEPPVDGAAPTTEPDPLESATPLAYTVNGETRHYDGIRVLGEHGAVIKPDALQGVIQRLSERDHYYEANQRQYQEARALEPLQTWITSGPDGKEQTLTGRDALMSMHVEHARKDALIEVMDQVLANPQAIVSLLMQDKDGNVLLDRDALTQLQREIRLSAGERATQVRERLSASVATASQPAPAPIDFASVAPGIIQNVAQEKGLDASSLTADERDILASQLQYHVKDNQVSLAWQQMATRMMTLAAQRKADTAKLADAKAAADKQNAARLSAAARGVQPKKPSAPAAPKPKAPSPASTRASDADQAWALRERLSSGRLSTST